MTTKHLPAMLLAALGLPGCTSPTGTVEQNAQVTGAVFTTTHDGSSVDANLYDAKEDVYLDGGPGPGAPAHAAGLPAGRLREELLRLRRQDFWDPAPGFIA